MNKYLIIVSMLLLGAGNCIAVEIKPMIGYGFLLNDIGALGSNESQTKGGFGGGVQVCTKLKNIDNLKVGGEIGYMPIYRWSYDLAAGWNMELKYRAVPVMGTAEYYFKGNDTFVPYGIFNCGIFITTLKSASTIAGAKSETSVSKGNFSAALGAGTIIKVKSTDFDLSARFIFVNDDTSEKTKLLTLNIGARFGL